MCEVMVGVRESLMYGVGHVILVTQTSDGIMKIQADT